jgi:hypothetical protein
MFPKYFQSKIRKVFLVTNTCYFSNPKLMSYVLEQKFVGRYSKYLISVIRSSFDTMPDHVGFVMD